MHSVKDRLHLGHCNTKKDLHLALRLLKRVIILAVFRKLFSINETQSSLQIEIIVDKIRDKCAPSWHPFFSLYMTMNLVMKSDHISLWSNHAKENWSDGHGRFQWFRSCPQLLKLLSRLIKIQAVVPSDPARKPCPEPERSRLNPIESSTIFRVPTHSRICPESARVWIFAGQT